MVEPEKIPFYVEINRIIELLAKQIYQSPLALLRENCQNSYDAILQRRHIGQEFEPKITINVSDYEIIVSDNGIGMTRDDLKTHYWRAGSSGKNTSEARAAGVVGTFGIGAMANFGIAESLEVVTESALTSERTYCRAVRATLSASDDCIEMFQQESTGESGTTVTAKVPDNSPVDINAAFEYIRQITRFLKVPVMANGQNISGEDFDEEFAETLSAPRQTEIGSNLAAIVSFATNRSNGEVSLKLEEIDYFGKRIDGVIRLRQNVHQIRTFRSRFALATAAVSSTYGLGGIADLRVLEPTAGREALTTESLQILQGIITECEKFISERLSKLEAANLNAGFMQWVLNHGRYELCGKLKARLEPGDRELALETIKEQSQTNPYNYFDGTDQVLIAQYASDEKPLVVASTRQPRRSCETQYIDQYCQVVKISNEPAVISRKNERNWTMFESALALRLIGVIEQDYFLPVTVSFGKISHNLPMLIGTDERPIEIVLDSDSSSVALILKVYEEDFSALTALVKDFIRTAVFPKIERFVPSSTKEGAEAFLKAMRRPRDVFEYESSDLGSLSGIWEEYLEGRISLSEAAQQSTTVVRNSVQVLDESAQVSVNSLLADVVENQHIIDQVAPQRDSDPYDAFPAITRLELESPAKLLTIGDEEQDLKGYKCFIAITDRVRKDRGDFFLQPHRTEIVWGGQKVLYIFQHHSGQFGLYYEFQGNELLSELSGGSSFKTCTIVLKNQIYIPIPFEISQSFIPKPGGRKRFEIRCELLYPDSE